MAPSREGQLHPGRSSTRHLPSVPCFPVPLALRTEHWDPEPRACRVFPDVYLVHRGLAGTWAALHSIHPKERGAHIPDSPTLSSLPSPLQTSSRHLSVSGPKQSALPFLLWDPCSPPAPQLTSHSCHFVPLFSTMASPQLQPQALFVKGQRIDM